MSFKWNKGAASGAVVLGLLAALPAYAQSITGICEDCQVELFASCGEGKFLEGPVFDSAGNLFLVGLSSGEILKVDTAGTCEAVGRTGGFPGGARMDADGKLIITDRNGLFSYDTETNTAELILSRYGNENLRGLNDSVIDKHGGIYFTEPNGSNALKPNGRVFYLSPDRTTLKLIADTFAFPNGVMLSPDELSLYVAEYAQKRIVNIPIDAAGGQARLGGNPFVFAYMEGGVGPDGMVVDTDGNLYVANFRAGQVVVYDPSGFTLGVISMPAEAGLGTTNLVLHEGYLYITEALNNDIWRVAVESEPHSVFE